MSFIHTTDAAMGTLNYPRKALDFYPTPAWVSEAVIPTLRKHSVTRDVPVWECACGDGAMAEVLKKHYDTVACTDLFNYGYGKPGVDFFDTVVNVKGAIVTNPPYGDLAERFIRHALARTEKHGGVVAMLLRNEYDSAKERVDLFKHPAFAEKLVLTSRPRWIEGSTGAPRHNYAWFLWNHQRPTSHPVISHHVREKTSRASGGKGE